MGDHDIDESEWNEFLAWKARMKGAAGNGGHAGNDSVSLDESLLSAVSTEEKIPEGSINNGASSNENLQSSINSVCSQERRSTSTQNKPTYTASDYLSRSKKYSEAKKIFQVS